MNLHLDTTVYGSDDAELGQLEGVLVDASTKTVTHLVIQEGLLFEHTQFVPVAWLRSADPTAVVLHATAQQFLGAINGEPDTGAAAQQEPTQLGSVSVIPPGYSRVELNEPITTPGSEVLLSYNAPVQTKDAVDIGRTQGLVIEAGGTIAHLIVVKGVMTPELKLVSADTIAEFADNLVLLSLGSDDADESGRWDELAEPEAG